MTFVIGKPGSIALPGSTAADDPEPTRAQARDIEEVGRRATVRNYLSSAISKTASRNRIEAAPVARDNGWL